MKILGALFLCSLFLHWGMCFSQSIVYPKLILDLLEEVDKPFSLIALTCWSPHNQTNFYKAWTSQTSTNIRRIHFMQPDQIPDYVQEHQLVFLLDLSCPNVVENLKKKYLIRAPSRWILLHLQTGIFNETNDYLIPDEIYNNTNILVDIEALVIREIGNNSFDAHYIYKIGQGTLWRTEFYARWNIMNGLQKVQNFTQVTALRRSNLEGQEIVICYVLTDSESINHLNDGVNDHIDTITKVNFPTTNQLLDFLNASRKFIFANSWGYRINNTWNGLTGYLVRGEVEIGGSPMFFTSERVSIVEYIVSPTPTRSKFVFQQPKLSYENNLFALSFRYTVWYCSIALLLLLFLTLFVVAKWEYQKKHRRDKSLKREDSGILSAKITDIAILVFGAICQQGSPVELKGSLGRIVMLILFLTLMFLYTSYSANIVALLQSSSSKIKTLEDLLRSRIKFGVHDTVFNRYYFATATEPTRKAIYETKVAPPGTIPRFMNMDEGVIRMRKGLFAFHMETGVGYKFVGKYFEEGEKCGLKEIQYLQVIDPWLAVKKNTSYMEMFKIGTKRIQEHGLQKRENQLLYAKRPKCSGREAIFVSVSIVDCYPALLIIAYGIILAIIMLFIEILYHKRRNLFKGYSKYYIRRK